MTPQDAVVRLVAAGWSEARIATEVGTSQPTIHRLKKGVHKRGALFDTCTAVIALAEREAVGGAGNCDEDSHATEASA